MRAPVLLLASLLCFNKVPAGAQEEENPEIKVYGTLDGVIYKSNLDGSGEQKLTDGYVPALSPNQRYVAFKKNRDLYLLDLETGEEEILVEYDPDVINASIADPLWHPDGGTIFFNMANLFLVDIYAVERDGTNFRLVVGGEDCTTGCPGPAPSLPTVTICCIPTA